MRILLAEDNEINQRVASQILQRGGHEVTAVGNGKEVVEITEEESFDLILMDLQMPIMDGWEATRVLKERENNSGNRIPIVAMTAHAIQGYRERCVEAGMDGYLSKPIRAEELLQQVLEIQQMQIRSAASLPSSNDRFCREIALSRLDGDAELLREVVTLLRESAPQRIAELKQAAACDDLPQIGRAAHALRGAIGYVDTGSALSSTMRLEELVSQGDLQGAKQFIPIVSHQIEQLLAAIHGFASETTG